MPYDPPGPPPRPRPRHPFKPPPRPDPKDNPSVMFGGAWDDDLGKVFHDLGEALLDTWPGRLLERFVERLSGLLRVRRFSEDEDLFGASDAFLGVEDRNARSSAWGLFAGWWKFRGKPQPYPPDKLRSLRHRLNRVLGDAHQANRPTGGSGVAIMRPTASLPISLAGEEVAASSVRIATIHHPKLLTSLSHDDLDAFHDKVTEMMGRVGLSDDENPVPPPPLRETD